MDEDKTLINNVMADDSEIFAIAIDKYGKMLHSIVNKYQLECGDYKLNYEDMYQEAMIALYDACKQYKCDKGVKFSTFVYTVVERKVRRVYYKALEIYLNEGSSIDNLAMVDHMENFQTLSVAENPISYHHAMDLKNSLMTTNRLSSSEKEILRLRIENYSYAEIASKLNIKEKVIDNKMYRLRKKFLAKDA